jgi:hypothetical protein
MPIVRTAVLLFGYPGGQQLNLRGNPAWYRQYFFNPSYGQSAYWAKQSANNIILDGEVFNWAFVNDPNPTLTNRLDVINFAINAMERDRGINFTSFDLVILVLDVPDNVVTDGGSTAPESSSRIHNGIVCRVKDRFDFVAHEIGHALGLNHSYGDWTYKNSPWSQHGEYGHPYCIMSAMGYGGTQGALFPAAPRDNRPEYSGLGPSLNAATALARGWLDAYVYNLQGAQPAEFVLRSRQWGDNHPNFPAPAQALDVRTPEGQNYVLEYRENSGWDEGQSSALIVNHGRGSTADLASPNTNSATFLKRIALPVTFGNASNVYNGQGFGIEVLERHVNALRIRIVPGRVQWTKFEFTRRVDTIASTILETGETTFRPGETYCVEGTWRYEKRSRLQVATFEASYALAVPPITSTWTVDGVVLANPSGTVKLPNKPVRVANARLDDVRSNRNVELRYEILAISKGSLLRLFNRVDDETFQIEVIATLATEIGSGTDADSVTFEGIKYEYPQAFYLERSKCMARDLAARIPLYKVLIPPDSWRRVPEERFLEVEQLLITLGHLRSQSSQRQYQQALSVLESITGVAPSQVEVVALDQRIALPRQADPPELLAPQIRQLKRKKNRVWLVGGAIIAVAALIVNVINREPGSPREE